jgi:photosystem II stability/assembly factor-like uncharacterized protein
VRRPTRNRTGLLTALGLAVLSLAVVRSANAADAANAADVWVPLGPNGGTVAALAIDPGDGNTVYAGTEEAGVYRSANGGRTWQPAGLDGGVTVLAVAPAPLAGIRAVYAVAGSNLWRSRDGGNSWTSLAPALLAAGATPAVTALAFSSTPGIVYAVAPQALPGPGVIPELLASTDGGDSWRVAGVPPAVDLLRGVFTDPGDPRRVFATTTGGVYVSADGAVTWARTLNGAVTGLAVEHGPRHRVLAFLRNGVSGIVTTEIDVSADRGQTWRPRNGPVDAFGVLADPTTPGAFVAAGETDLYRTTDAGLHWASVGPLPRSTALALALDPVRPGVAFVAVPGGSLGRTVWKTADDGAAWTPFIRGLFACDFLTVLADPAAPATLWASGALFGGSPFGLWKSSDRGASWVPGGFNEASVPYLAFGGIGGNHRLFAGVLGQGLQESADFGQHWTPVALPFDNVGALAIPAGEPNTLYVLGPTQDSAQLEVSRNGGATWTTRELHASFLEVSPGSAATLYANSRTATFPQLPGMDSVERSTDRGATWTTILEIPDGLVSGIGLDPLDPQRVVVASQRILSLVSGAVETTVQWTADGGTTWHVLPTQPFAVSSLLPDPLVPHGFLAGTGVGAFASADGGASWTRLGVGLPRTVTSLSLDPSSPRTVYAATEGGGVYRLARTVP